MNIGESDRRTGGTRDCPDCYVCLQDGGTLGDERGSAVMDYLACW